MLQGKCGSNNCFDGVFINNKTGEISIVEVKPLKDNGITLNPKGKGTDLPEQMTNAWITHAVNRLDGKPETQATFDLLQKVYSDKTETYNVQKVVVGVNSQQVKLVVLK